MAARRSRRRWPFIGAFLALLALPQLVALPHALRLAAGLGGWLAAALALAAVLTLNLTVVLELRGGREERPLPRAAVVGLLLPFYVWWAGAGLTMLALAAHGLWTAVTGAAGMRGSTVLPMGWVLAPFGVALYGFWSARVPRRERVQLSLPGLGDGWSGARIVQLSDLHAGRFFGEERLEAMATRVARLQPDLVVVTGDMVDISADYAPAVARALSSIQAPLGVWACLGNHDHYAGAARVQAALEQGGIRVLVNQGVTVHRNGDPLWLCGVDDLWFGADDLDAALLGKPHDVPAVLLCHNPELFPEAAEAGVELTLSGHTHAGQIGLVGLHRSLSPARLMFRYVCGLYADGDSQLYVSRGTGTIRPLIRLGAPPELAELTLA